MEFTALNVGWDKNAYGSIVWALLALHTTHMATDVYDSGVLVALAFFKDFDGRKFGDAEVKKDLGLVPYAIVEHDNGDAWVATSEGKKLSPQEVSARILEELCVAAGRGARAAAELERRRAHRRHAGVGAHGEIASSVLLAHCAQAPRSAYRDPAKL